MSPRARTCFCRLAVTSLTTKNAIGLTFLGTVLSMGWSGPAACRAAEAAAGASFYVSTAGRDDWSGRLAEPNPARTDGPFATLAKARDAAGQVGSQAAGPVVVYVRGGLYTLKEPLVFTPRDSGTPQAPVVYAAYPGEVPVLVCRRCSARRHPSTWTTARKPWPG
jgi:hypothetical protein